MTVTVAGQSFPCTRAVKDGDGNAATLYLSDGGMAEFRGIHDWDAITIEDGDWSLPDITPQEQLRADLDFLAIMTGVTL